MPFGPGKYDDLCSYVREQVGGAVVLIVLGGDRGPGVSVQGDDRGMVMLPDLLETVARQIRQDNADLSKASRN
jgi:hypothetical protein